MPFRCEEVLFSPATECNLSCPHCSVVKTPTRLSIIAAKKFNHGTENGVADEVGGEHLAVEFFVPEQPRQKKIEGEV